MTSNTPLHLAAALDGAGWHPAAWREPNSRPDELFTGAYWTDLAAVAQRGLLDFVTIEDSLAAPVNSHAPDAADSVDRVRARIDAHLVAVPPHRPGTHRAGLGGHREGHAAAGVGRPVRRGRRLRRGRPPAMGQLGGRRRDPRRRDSPVHRP